MRSRTEAARLADSLVGESPAGKQPPVDQSVRKSDPPLFATANKGSGINPDMERIVDFIYAADAFKDYEDLEKNLEVGEERGDYKTLQTHLDKAEGRARRAHLLFLGARLEQKKWELDSEAVLAGMRKSAVADLEKEKEVGDRTKRITNDDVDARMRELFPDEWRAQEIKRVKLKGTVDHLEWDAGLWKNKCFSLSTMLSNLRK
jgi:hypothetical protein